MSTSWYNQFGYLGAHWVVIDLGRQVKKLTRAVLDWEAAHAEDYRVEGRAGMETWRVFFDSGLQ